MTRPVRVVVLPRGTQGWLGGIALGGLATVGVGAALAPEQAFQALLVAAFLLLTIALGSVVFLAFMSLAKAGWSSVLRRVPEALAACLPLTSLALLATLPGLAVLYEWVDGDAGGKAVFLNPGFFAARMLAILALWMLFAWLLRRESRRQDADGLIVHTGRSVKLSAGFLVLFAITFSLASFDWLMSLESHWASTIYALYNISGLLVAAVAAIAIVVILLDRKGLLPGLSTEHIHDLGKLAFAFSTLWAYLWISQYLLIWYANMPEETSYFLRRTSGGWSFLFYLNLVANWLVPFIVLLPRSAKRSREHLLRVCALLLAGRWLDIYLMVAPATSPTHTGINVFDVAAVLGLGALFALVLARALGAAPLTPRSDPYLGESLHHHS